MLTVTPTQGRLTLLLPKFETSHFDKILRDFGYPLFTLVNGEIRPMYEFFINLSEYSEAP